MSANAYYNRPCPICAGTTFSWGTFSTGGSSDFAFHDQSRTRKAGFVTYSIGEDLRGRRCLTCGNLQIFARPPEGES